MALETLRNEITNVESTQIRGLLELFVNLLEQKNEEVITLKNQVQNLEERVLEMEKYSSKDCLIIDNMPLGHGKVTLEEQVCAFLKQYLNYQSNPSNFRPVIFWENTRKAKSSHQSSSNLCILVKKLKSLAGNLGSLANLIRSMEEVFIWESAFHFIKD